MGKRKVEMKIFLENHKTSGIMKKISEIPKPTSLEEGRGQGIPRWLGPPF